MLVKDVEQQVPSFTAGENTKWYSYFGTRWGGFLQNQTYSYHMILPAITLIRAYPEDLKTMFTQKSAQGCL